MAGFVTELTTDIPQIIFIIDEPTIVLPAEKVIRDQKLATLTLSVAEALKPERLAALMQAYKIVWWVLPSESVHLPAAYETLAAKLAEFHDKLFVVTTRSSGPASQAESTVFAWLKQHVSQTTLLVGRDVIIDQGNLSHPVLARMLAGVSDGVIPDPDISLYLQTMPDFAQSVGFKLLKPRVGSSEIQGKKTHSSVIAKLLSLNYQRLFGVTLEIKSQPAVTPAASTSFPEEVTLFPENPEQVIQVLLPWLQKHPPKTKAVEPAPPRVEQPPATFRVQPISGSIPEPPRSRPVAQIKPLLSFKTTVQPNTPHPATQPAAKPDTLADLETDLSHLFKDYRTEKKATHVTKLVAETRTTTRHSLRKERMFWVGMVGFGLLSAIVAFYGFFWLTLFQLKNQIKQISEAPPIAVSTPASATHAPTNFWLSVGKAQTTIYAPILTPLGFEDAQAIVGFSDDLNQLQFHQQSLLQNATSLFLAMMNRYPVDVATQLSSTLAQSQALYQDVSLAQSFLKDMRSDVVDDQALQKLKSQLSVTKRVSASIQELQPILGDLIGLNGKRTYAVVFQNNQELRATSGVIQSVGFVTIDHGLVIDTQTLSAAEIDTRLSGIALPPAEVTKYLGGSRWHFEDVTWNPDTVATSQEITLFLEKATRFNVDGVILTNVTSLQDWLSVVGPVDVPEYKEEITGKNLSERLEAHSELQVNGDQSQEYSTVALQHLLQKTMQTPEAKLTELFASFYRQAEAKQLTFYLRRPNELAAFDRIGWTGALLSPSCPQQLQQERCYVDPVAEIESNVGINKANIYIDRQVSDDITIADGLIKHERKISLINKAVSNAWPRGTYKTFIRFYVAPSATLDAITINGQPVDAKQYQITVEQNRTVYGVYVEVPIQQSLDLAITYSEFATTDTAFSYSLFNQFQSGITPPPFHVTIQAPGHRPTLIAPQAQVTDGVITFTSPQTLDALLGVKYE